MIREEEGSVYWVSDYHYYVCMGRKKVVLDNIVIIIVSHELMTIYYIDREQVPYTVYWYFTLKDCEDDYYTLRDILKNRGKIFENIKTDDGFAIKIDGKSEINE